MEKSVGGYKILWTRMSIPRSFWKRFGDPTQQCLERKPGDIWQFAHLSLRSQNVHVKRYVLIWYGWMSKMLQHLISFTIEVSVPYNTSKHLYSNSVVPPRRESAVEASKMCAVVEHNKKNGESNGSNMNLQSWMCLRHLESMFRLLKFNQHLFGFQGMLKFINLWLSKFNVFNQHLH